MIESREHCGTCTHARAEGFCARWEALFEQEDAKPHKHAADARLRLEAWVAEVRRCPGWTPEGPPAGPIASGCPEWRERVVSPGVTV